MKFSKRTDWANTPNPLTEAIARKRQSNQPLIDLTESNPTRCSFKYLNADLLEPLRDLRNLVYEPDPRGLLEAREAVCEYYAAKNVKLDPRQIFLTAGTSEAYAFLFRLLLDPGDKAVVPQPSYPLFDYLADLNDVRLERYPLLYENGWRIDVSRAEAPLLVLVNPNNPTGNFVRENEREAINRLCGEKGAAIISDEVFIDFPIGGKGTKNFTFAGNKEILSFALGGVSKILGLPQMKLSWIAASGPPPLWEEAVERLEIIADTYLSVNTPCQRALSEWFKKRGRVIEEMRDRLLVNQRYLESKFKNSAGAPFAALLQSEGGWYSVLQIQSGLSDEELALRLIQNQNVIVHPGYFFDFEKENFLVLSLLLPEVLFQKGVDALGEGLKN